VSNYVYTSNTANTTHSGLAGNTALQPALRSKQVMFSAKQLQEGRSYMTSQWRQMGVEALKSRAVFAQPKAVTQADGKVSVPITSFLADWNKEAAKALRPVMRALKNLDLPPFIDKRKLETRPLDFVIDIFDPVLDRFEAACNRTQRQHIPKGVVDWFGKKIDIRISQPGDQRMDASTRNFVRKMRIIQSFILLFFNKPLELAGECLKEGVDLAGDIGREVGQAVDKTLREAGKTAQKAAEEAGKAVAGAFDWIKGATGLGYFGEAATAGTGAAAAGTTAAGGVAIEQVVQQVLEKIMASLAEKIPEVAANMATTAATKGIESAFSPPPAPTEVSPPSPVLAPAAVGPATAGSATAGSRDQADTTKGADFPVLPVAVAAGFALLFLARR